MIFPILVKEYKMGKATLPIHRKWWNVIYFLLVSCRALVVKRCLSHQHNLQNKTTKKYLNYSVSEILLGQISSYTHFHESIKTVLKTVYINSRISISILTSLQTHIPPTHLNFPQAACDSLTSFPNQFSLVPGAERDSSVPLNHPGQKPDLLLWLFPLLLSSSKWDVIPCPSAVSIRFLLVTAFAWGFVISPLEVGGAS